MVKKCRARKQMDVCAAHISISSNQSETSTFLPPPPFPAIYTPEAPAQRASISCVLSHYVVKCMLIENQTIAVWKFSSPSYVKREISAYLIASCFLILFDV
jgi:hypothetical protein